MSAGHHRSSQTWGRMLNHEPEIGVDDIEYTCRICREVVCTGEPTERGIEIQSCRDCEAKRIAQLVRIEEAYVKLQRSMKTVLFDIANKASFEAGNLEI